MPRRSRILVPALACLAVCLLTAPRASADTIGDYNLAAFTFDVTAYNTGGGSGITGQATASGTSNGIGWSIGPTNIWSGRTNTTGTFSFSSLPVLTDNLHVSSAFTVTFDRPIAALLVALSNDNNTGDAINFSAAPVDLQGALSVSGTQVTQTSPAGGLVLFTNINALTVTHIDNNGQTDGFDFAFHAVPEPTGLLLLGAGLALARIARRRT
ncbi:MAG: PEP-CTERM sorting domain-containing protein [Acidobacteria bacterium]|jgi:hypothetical protein|nr:PEP-CTERM sorting domain-containing protein [Acidobacteriota bacterium]